MNDPLLEEARYRLRIPGQIRDLFATVLLRIGVSQSGYPHLFGWGPLGGLLTILSDEVREELAGTDIDGAYTSAELFRDANRALVTSRFILDVQSDFLEFLGIDLVHEPTRASLVRFQTHSLALRWCQLRRGGEAANARLASERVALEQVVESLTSIIDTLLDGTDPKVAGPHDLASMVTIREAAQQRVSDLPEKTHGRAVTKQADSIAVVDLAVIFLIELAASYRQTPWRFFGGGPETPLEDWSDYQRMSLSRQWAADVAYGSRATSGSEVPQGFRGNTPISRLCKFVVAGTDNKVAKTTIGRGLGQARRSFPLFDSLFDFPRLGSLASGT